MKECHLHPDKTGYTLTYGEGGNKAIEIAKKTRLYKDLKKLNRKLNMEDNEFYIIGIQEGKQLEVISVYMKREKDI